MISTEDSGLTRYAGNRIHQHVAERNAEVRVRAARGEPPWPWRGNQTHTRGRLPGGPARCRDGHAQPVPILLQRSARARRRAHTSSRPPSTSPPPAWTRRGGRRRCGTSWDCWPVRGATGYGVVTNGVAELAVANSHGLHAYQAFTDAFLSVIAHRPETRRRRRPARAHGRRLRHLLPPRLDRGGPGVGLPPRPGQGHRRPPSVPAPRPLHRGPGGGSGG